MKLFPAIDIMDGNCVRLLYGDKNKVTVYGSAVEMAKKWEKAGASFLHVVDLDGAFTGDSKNLPVVRELVNAVSIPVQLGGGIRTLADVEERILQTGVSRVILGTAAVTLPDFAARAAERFPGAVACGIDVKDGRISIKGWTEEVAETPEDFGRRIAGFGIKVAVYTDISRDGALTGVNVAKTKAFGESTGLSVIASGGVKDLEDIRALTEAGVYGAILGKSLYTGAIDLREALCLQSE